MLKKIITGIVLVLALLSSGCRVAYILHAAVGQYRLVYHSVEVEDALKDNSLSPDHKNHLILVAAIKDFGVKELGLKENQNYQSVYLKSHHPPIYTVSASPKDRLTRIRWWFPVVGRMPYLGFFDLESAKAEKSKLLKKDLDVSIGVADAYSTLGWFKDPVTLNLIEGSTANLVETILHEMTHTTLYLKGRGEFNESLANLAGKVGALSFFKRNYGTSHSFTLDAKNILEDERMFSSFLNRLLNRLGHLYGSQQSYQQKLAVRERLFKASLEEFGRLKGRLLTNRFKYFGSSGMNNAYLMSFGLYHRHFHLFEAALKWNQGSLRETILFFKDLAKEDGPLLEKIKRRIDSKSKS